MQSKSQTSALSAYDFGQLYEKHKQNFVVVARSYVRNNMVAEDIVTDCFLYFWENREKIDITRGIPAYILTAVKSRCLNWLRDEKTRLKIQQNIHTNSLRLVAQRIETLETNDPDSVFAQEIAAIIERELKNMPEKTRNIFFANRLEDKTYAEIAELFGMSFNQVEYEIRKALKILESALADYLPGLIFALFISDTLV